MDTLCSIALSQRDDGIAVLTFDQPGSKANVLTPKVWTDFANALADAKSLPSIRGLIVASAKPGIFIAGADLKFFANVPGPDHSSVRTLAKLGLRSEERR